MCGMGGTCQLSPGGGEGPINRLTLWRFLPRRQRCRAASRAADKGGKPALVFTARQRTEKRMADEPAVTAAILVIGDEILSGRTKDKKSATSPST